MQSVVRLQRERPALGWVGTGRMGTAMAGRALDAGLDLTVFNRTRAKTEPLVAQGAARAGSLSELAACDVVFVTVGSSEDLLAVLGDGSGLLDGPDRPEIVIDCSTVSSEASSDARTAAAAKDVGFLAAPVSGNPKVAEAGELTMAVSGPRESFDAAEHLLRLVAKEVTYVGDGELARLVKLCHNLFLGAVFQSLAEVAVLAEKGGVRRADFLAFMNGSVLGSTFSGYKTPSIVELDYEPTFTTRLLRKDFDLGMGAARSLEVPMPVASVVHQRLGEAIGRGLGDVDFAALLEIVAGGAGLELRPEHGSGTP